MKTLRRIAARPAGAASLAVLFLVAVLAAFGPAIAPNDPLAQNAAHILEGPSSAHLLGTDYVGRDVFSRLVSGSTLSVVAALEAVVIGFVLGVVPAVASVYSGRAVEWVLLRIFDSFMALPFITFAIAMAALLGNGLHQAMFAVGILVSPTFFRITRAATQTHSNTQFVEAAVLLGQPMWRVVVAHVWPKVLPTVMVTLAGVMAGSLLVVSSLAFLGIGVVPPEPTWGGMLASDLGYLTQRPYGPLAPALMIMLTVGALGVLADLIRDDGRADKPGSTRRQQTRATAQTKEAAAS